MKKHYFLITAIFALLAVLVLNGCDNSTGNGFDLENPIIFNDFNTTQNHVYWNKVPKADFYILYGKEFEYDGIEGPDDPSPIPMYGNLLTEKLYQGPALEYFHITTKDYAYAVMAWTNDGKHSDYSGIVFTMEWPNKP